MGRNLWRVASITTILIIMKRLIDYINENLRINESEDPKTFTFSFKELPNAKETIDSLVSMAQDKGLDIESSEDSFTIKLTRELCTDNRDKIDGIQDVLQQYSDLNRKDTKNASSESFAQLTNKFEKKVDEFVEFIDNANNDDDNKDDEE